MSSGLIRTIAAGVLSAAFLMSGGVGDLHAQVKKPDPAKQPEPPKKPDPLVIKLESV